MRTLVMMHSPAMARQLALELENLGEEWQVHWACDMPSGLKKLRSGAVEMLIVDQQMAQIPGKAGLGAVTAHPPLPPPWLLSMGEGYAPVLLSFFALSIKKEKSVVAGGSSSTAIILSFLSNIELFIFKS